jgi:hypothetical protein
LDFSEVSNLLLLLLGEIAITPENFFPVRSFQCYKLKPCGQITKFVHFPKTPIFKWKKSITPIFKNINSGHKYITLDKWTKAYKTRTLILSTIITPISKKTLDINMTLSFLVQQSS